MSESTVPTITTEGNTVDEALQAAAAELGVAASLVLHKLDVSHFRTPEGRSRPVDTVKIIAWARDAGEIAGAEAGLAWVRGLLEEMGVQSRSRVRVTGGREAAIDIDSPRAAHLVGRAGSNLRAILHLLECAMQADHGDWTFSLNVIGGERRDRDDRPRDHDRDDRGRGRDRDDRGRGRGRDRDDRGRGRDRDRDGRRDFRGRDDRDRDDRGRDDRPPRRDRDDQRSERDLDKLKDLARRLAAEAIESGEPVRIRRQLNSYERRMVHVTVSEIDGVETQSVGEGQDRTIVIQRAEGGAPAEA